TPPPRVPAPQFDYRPPERTPLGTETWSTGQVRGVTSPEVPLGTRFNRAAGDQPASDGLTDRFNHAGRGTH
ncbi:MAG: hypothetical protein AAFX62_17000, partial [Pseudomonadota bacterium]